MELDIIRAVAICLDSALPMSSNLDLIKDAIEASTTELMSETTSIISTLAENAIKSISVVEEKCQEILCKEQEHTSLEDNLTPPQPGHLTYQTYAEVLRRSCPPKLPDNSKHRAILAKEGMMRKQILVDGIESRDYPERLYHANPQASCSQG